MQVFLASTYNSTIASIALPIDTRSGGVGRETALSHRSRSRLGAKEIRWLSLAARQRTSQQEEVGRPQLLELI
jgi:hypothetical protein